MVRSLWICLTIVSAATATGLIRHPALDERHLDSSVARWSDEYGDQSGSSVFADPRLFRRARWRPGGGGDGGGGNAGGGGGGESSTTTAEAQFQPPPTDPPNPDPPPPSDSSSSTTSQPSDPAPAPQSTPSSNSGQPTATLPGAAVASVPSVASQSTTAPAPAGTSPASQSPPQPQNQVTTSNTPSSMLAVYIIVGIAGFLLLIALVLHFIRGKRVAASRSQSRVSYPFIGQGRSAGSREEGFTMVQTRSADVASTTDASYHPPPQLS